MSHENQEDTVSPKNEDIEEEPVVKELLVLESVNAPTMPVVEEKVQVIEEKVEADKIEAEPVAITVTQPSVVEATVVEAIE